MLPIYPLVEALFLVIALSLDAFASGLAYGTNRIRIPLNSVLLISLICTAFLALSLWGGAALKPLLPELWAKLISALLLFGMGAVKIFDSAVKALIRRWHDRQRHIGFSVFNVQVILSIYADPEHADADHSKDLSLSEAAYLATALSLDGIAIGLSAALLDAPIGLILLFSLLANALSVFGGSWLGNRLSERFPMDLSWIGGVILIGLAVIKLG